MIMSKNTGHIDCVQRNIFLINMAYNLNHKLLLKNITNRGLRYPLFALAGSLLLLSACTSDSGDSITLSSGSQGSDPVLLEIPIAYVKRPLPDEMDDTPDLRDPLAFNPGVELFVRSRSDTSAEEINVTDQILSVVAAEEGVTIEELAIDIKGLETSFDGKRLIFAARVVPEPVDNNLEFTTWNIWLFNFETRQAQYLVPSRIKRNEGLSHGGGHDTAPHFLTDDRIVLSSTRQTAIAGKLLNEGRAQIYAGLDEERDDPASVLHIYDPSMGDESFQQISFNPSHDFDPVALSTGEIVFSRWNRSRGNDHLSLFSINPSGIGLSNLYGYHSQDIGTNGVALELTQPREFGNGQLIALARSFQAESYGGNIIIINKNGFTEYDQPTWANQGQGGNGHASISNADIRTDDQISPGGQYAAVYPINDGSNRVLMSWSPCRVIDENGRNVPCTIGPANGELAPPLYGAWIYDPSEGTQLPVVKAQEGFMISEIVAGEPRAYPDSLNDSESFDSELALNDKGALLIDSVYDLDGVDSSVIGIANQSVLGSMAHANRSARFIRFTKPVPIPDEDIFEIPNYAFGVSASRFMMEIVGYSMVEPDGSVSARVPANTPLSFSILDSNGRRIGSRHNYWIQLAAGEVLHCTGCHTNNSELPHGRIDSQPESSNPGAISLLSGAIGFTNMDTSLYCGSEIGQTMARIYNMRRPDCSETIIGRDLSLQLSYSDEWTGPASTPDSSFDYSYDPAWMYNPTLITANLDPSLDSRIVINYIDHIQPIWERVRIPVDDGTGVLIDTCVGCHNSIDTITGDPLVPSGQLDLTSLPSDINSDHYRSYRELLSRDDEQLIDEGGVLVNRQRACTEEDIDGNVLNFTLSVAVQASMRASGANNSNRFFRCFDSPGPVCGTVAPSTLPDGCEEDTNTPSPSTINTVNHAGMLSDAELRLISEWLDVGAQYYNNPFDPRLAP
jgi:hypothetical protein